MQSGDALNKGKPKPERFEQIKIQNLKRIKRRSTTPWLYKQMIAFTPDCIRGYYCSIPPGFMGYLKLPRDGAETKAYAKMIYDKYCREQLRNDDGF